MIMEDTGESVIRLGFGANLFMANTTRRVGDWGPVLVDRSV